MADDFDQIEEQLRRIDESASDSPQPGGDAAGGNIVNDVSLSRLADALCRAAASGTHLTPEQLLAEVRDRQQALDQSTQWQPSEHLAACLLCFDAFEALIGEKSEVTPATIDRYSALLKPVDDLQDIIALIRPPQPASHASRFRRWGLGVGIAALLIMGVMLGLRLYHAPTSAYLHTGQMVFKDGTTVPDTEPIPARRVVIAREPVATFFSDGSRLQVEKDAQFSISESFSGDTSIQLERGVVEAHVAKQEPGHRFSVITPLGEVIVVGTRFSVESRSEQVVTYQTGDGLPTERPVSREEKVTAVTVKVFEGVVKVRNRHKQEVRLPAGGTAVIREGQAIIDVTGAVAP